MDLMAAMYGPASVVLCGTGTLSCFSQKLQNTLTIVKYLIQPHLKKSVEHPLKTRESSSRRFSQNSSNNTETLTLSVKNSHFFQENASFLSLYCFTSQLTGRPSLLVCGHPQC